MMIESDLKDNSGNELSSQTQKCNNSISQILSIEIPKIIVIVLKRPLNQKEISTKEVDNISIIEENKVVITELKKKFRFNKIY